MKQKIRKGNAHDTNRPKTKKFSATLTVESIRELDRIRKGEGISRAELIRRYVEDGLERRACEIVC